MNTQDTSLTSANPQAEYEETRNTYRHYSNLRLATLTVFFTLITAVGIVAFGLFDSEATPEQLLIAKVFGIVITVIFYFFEELTHSFMGLANCRAEQLEADSRLNYSFWRKRSTKMNAFANVVTRAPYWAIFLLWLWGLCR